VVFGELVEPEGHHAGALPDDLNGREIGILVPLAALCVFLGVYPQPVLTALEAPVTRIATIVEDGAAARATRVVEVREAHP
jgi:NADH:ubiquinone oxidoreductase subunit 4 (subunit M)